MVQDTDMITVRNLTDQERILYIIPELNVRRRFSAFESKQISVKELRQL